MEKFLLYLVLLRPTGHLDENYCKTSPLLHWPNWRTLSDIKDQNLSWTEKFTSFLELDFCPNFVKADVDRAKDKQIDDSPPEEDIPNNDADQPEWMEVIRPNPYFDELST